MRLMPRALTRSWLVLAAVVVTVLPATTPALAAVAAPSGARPHAVGGFQPGSLRTPAKSTLGGASASEVFPASVDLRPYAPAVGDQGQIGACVAWTIGYSIMGYWANRTGGAGAPYAPLFLYLRNVAKGGAPTAGLVPDYVLANAQTAGVDTQADYWQGTTNWQTAPVQTQIDNARNYRVNGWSRLFNGPDQGAAAQTSIMRTLASGSPVALGIPVYRDFMYLGSHSLYSTTSGTNIGGHMMAAYGYDAAGVYVRNSWGSGWGNGGDAHLSWSFITKAALAGYAVNGINTPAGPVAAAPTVSALSTTRAPAGTSVTITGTGLSTATGVRFGGTVAAFVPQTTNGLTQLVAVAPAHATGVVDVTVTNPSGTSAVSATGKFTYIPPAPVVVSVTPGSGLTYKRTPVVIKGTDLTGATQVLIGATPVGFTKVSGTELKVTLPIGTAGEQSLRVVTPGGTSTAGPAATFTYLTPAAPVLTSIVPATGRTYARTAVVINGENFTDSTRLTVGGKPVSYTKVSATQIKALLPTNPAGAVDVQLSTPGGATALGPDARFTYTVPPVPVISALSASSAITKLSHPLTITGTGLTGATKVVVGTVAVRFTSVSDTEITLRLPARAKAGAAPVTVITPGGTSQAASFTYVLSLGTGFRSRR
jgi:hypothetical protein